MSERVLGYYPDVNAALKGLCKKQILGTGLKDLETVDRKINELYEYIDRVVTRL